MRCSSEQHLYRDVACGDTCGRPGDSGETWRRTIDYNVAPDLVEAAITADARNHRRTSVRAACRHAGAPNNCRAPQHFGFSKMRRRPTGLLGRRTRGGGATPPGMELLQIQDLEHSGTQAR